MKGAARCAFLFPENRSLSFGVPRDRPPLLGAEPWFGAVFIARKRI
jgi:hypothetical protein